MCTSSHEKEDIVASLRQKAAKVAADPTAPNHADAHGSPRTLSVGRGAQLEERESAAMLCKSVCVCAYFAYMYPPTHTVPTL